MTGSQGFASPGIGQSPSTDRKVSPNFSFLYICNPRSCSLSMTSVILLPSSPPFFSPFLYLSFFLLVSSFPPFSHSPIPLPHTQGGRSQDITPVTAAQVYSAAESGDKFKIDNREISQVRPRGRGAGPEERREMERRGRGRGRGGERERRGGIEGNEESLKRRKEGGRILDGRRVYTYHDCCSHMSVT